MKSIVNNRTDRCMKSWCRFVLYNKQCMQSVRSRSLTHCKNRGYLHEGEKIWILCSWYGNIKFMSSSFLLYRHTDDCVFDDFPKISNHFPKILQNLLEGHTNVAENVPIISEDYRRHSRKTRRCFDDTPI